MASLLMRLVRDELTVDMEERSKGQNKHLGGLKLMVEEDWFMSLTGDATVDSKRRLEHRDLQAVEVHAYTELEEFESEREMLLSAHEAETSGRERADHDGVSVRAYARRLHSRAKTDECRAPIIMGAARVEVVVGETSTILPDVCRAYPEPPKL